MSRASFVVSLKEARYLHETEWLTKQDPYALIWTSSTKDLKACTKTFKNGGKRATWEETFTLNVDNVATESFFMEIMNKNGLTPDKLIGRTKFACADIDYKSVETWVKIYGENGADAGEVKIAAYRNLEPGEQPSEGQLQQNQQEVDAQKRMVEEQVRLLQQQKQRDDEQLRIQHQQRQEELRRDEEIKQLRRDEEIRQLRRDEEIKQLRRDEEIRQLRHDEEIKQLRREEEIKQLRLDEEKKQRQHDEQLRMEQQRQQLNQAPTPTQLLPPPSAPSSYVLPPGWTSAIDPASNRTYYANKVMQTTQWERPGEVAGAGLGSNVQSDSRPLVYATAIENPAVAYQSTPLATQQSYQQLQPQQQQQQQQQPHLVPRQGIEQYQQPVSQLQQSQRTLQPNLYVSQQQLLSPLPPGWSQKMTPEGRPYYYNHISEKTTWDRP